MCLSNNFCLCRTMNPQRGEMPHTLKTCTRKISRVGGNQPVWTTTLVPIQHKVADICYGCNENMIRSQLLAITKFHSGRVGSWRNNFLWFNASLGKLVREYSDDKQFNFRQFTCLLIPFPDTTQLLLLGKVEYGWGPIFKVVLEF